ncbi:hypothetical protein HMI01_08450 [Halolactibacillus miurensis]|uniref:Thiol-disulfide isomerase or thioredoxin n=1 Tax=Halolactibacillus miurensis TaxID=306541 RepID=A0A1I6RFC0_9BACI|nr:MULTISPECIES: TlpA disulfide reductase family protein [Halolactibacillus]GEM03857.1 hypothetical protein HMI01_08450 [Halolactibacillus miurensis]SFS63355.1 Thiol-disulfide isomerase or thioredoxin [Halolactibacillus miurensis]
MTTAPDFTLPYIDKDDHLTLSDLRGRMVLLTFWASWCPDCSQDMPMKERLFKTVDQNKLAMITINVTGRERHHDDAVRYKNNFIKQPTLVDNGRETYLNYTCLGVPTTVLIDQQGHIVKQWGQNLSFPSLMEAISAYL